MSQSEGWIITALGMTVVFVGLLLCVAFIQLFSRISKRVTWGEGGHGDATHGAAPAAAPETAAGGDAVRAGPRGHPRRHRDGHRSGTQAVREPARRAPAGDAVLIPSERDPMHTHLLRIAGRDYKAEVKELTPERAVVLVDGKEYAVDLVRIGRKKMTAEAVKAITGGAPASTAPAAAAAASSPAPRPAPSGRGEGGITAPMPGLVLTIKVKEGDTVQAGQALLVMEAMKMENAITASYNGTVTKVYVREGDSISEGDLLVEVARPKMTAL